MFLSQENISQIQQYFSSCPINKAYLFGSFARGDADEKSDVDLLVELDYNQHIGLNFFDYKFDLEKSLNRKVDLISFDGLSPIIASIVNAEKKLIYAK
jgi:predicted nucleotidyltransferase